MPDIRLGAAMIQHGLHHGKGGFLGVAGIGFDIVLAVADSLSNAGACMAQQPQWA